MNFGTAYRFDASDDSVVTQSIEMARKTLPAVYLKYNICISIWRGRVRECDALPSVDLPFVGK